jgi:aminoglycoside 6-adenylyltransferase
VSSRVSAERLDEYRRVVDRVVAWASNRPDVVAVAVAGSWARGEQRIDSDIDAVILTTDPARYTTTEDWIEPVTGQPAPIVRRQDWGVLQERRVRLSSGLEVEFGFVFPSWASTDPLDQGTRTVVQHGLRAVHDPHGLLRRLVQAVSDAAR